MAEGKEASVPFASGGSFAIWPSFVNPLEEARRGMGQAFIPAPNEPLKALRKVNPDLLRFAQQKSPQTVATLEMDASIVVTTRQDALVQL